MNTTYAYFPGCSSHGTSKEFDSSTKAVCAKLGIGLEEMKDWICCGATPVHAVDPVLSTAIATKNLSIASGMKKDVAVACAACFSRLKSASKHLNEDAEQRERMNKLADSAYDGSVDVKHTLTIMKELGAERIQSAISKKLEGLKVACYYGCLLLRPPKVTEFDDPENPTIMESIISLTGAETVDWNYRTECCGASFSMPDVEIVIKLGNDILSDAKKHGADVVAAACPLCQMNLDLRQADMEKRYSKSLRLPVVYFTQLLGLSMGVPAAELGLSRLIVSPEQVLKEKNII